VKVTPDMAAQAIRETDWAAIDALTDEDIDRQIAEDPNVAPDMSDFIAAMRVRMVRRKLKLTQAQFARRFRVPLGTLRDWEQGRREPDAPAVALLRIIEREPAAATRALARDPQISMKTVSPSP
jgi:putative transcriptional regulator